MRDSVLFYRSFFDALRNIPDADRLRVYDAIMEYSMYDVEPNLDGTSLAVFLLVKPQIDANNKRYEFQSTLPRRERHLDGETIIRAIQISIHAPTKGATPECIWY